MNKLENIIIYYNSTQNLDADIPTYSLESHEAHLQLSWQKIHHIEGKNKVIRPNKV